MHLQAIYPSKKYHFKLFFILKKINWNIKSICWNHMLSKIYIKKNCIHFFCFEILIWHVGCHNAPIIVICKADMVRHWCFECCSIERKENIILNLKLLSFYQKYHELLKISINIMNLQIFIKCFQSLFSCSMGMLTCLVGCYCEIIINTNKD